MRRVLCLLLVAAMLLGFAGCAGGTGTSAPTSEPPVSDASTHTGPANFAVAYSREDTLDPFAAQTAVNVALAGLLYSGLTAIDGSFTPQLALAESVERTDATHLKVTLRRGAVFSDGSAIQPSDVVTSFQQARSSANYRALLENVTAATADKKANTVVFTLASADPHAEACLSFPVVKAGTLTTQAGAAPVGAGLYMLKTDGDEASLQCNSYAGSTPQYTTVGLRHLPNADTMYYGLTSGNITYYFNDLSSGVLPRVTGASAAVDMNALLYLGVNSASAGVSNAAVRQAISGLIDRKSLVESAFSGWARAASTPFHPAFGAARELTGIAAGRDLTGSVQLLEGAGYGTAAGQTRLTLELIYSNEGGSRSAAVEQVRSQLESAGVQVTVTPLSYAEYKSRLSAGRYDLYLGEVRLPANMSLAALMPGGAAAYGISSESPAVAAYRQYLAGEITMQVFTDAFLQDLPYIPLCWRSGFAAFDRRLATVTPHGFNVYYGFAAWQ